MKVSFVECPYQRKHLALRFVLCKEFPTYCNRCGFKNSIHPNLPEELYGYSERGKEGFIKHTTDGWRTIPKGEYFKVISKKSFKEKYIELKIRGEIR